MPTIQELFNYGTNIMPEPVSTDNTAPTVYFRPAAYYNSDNKRFFSPRLINGKASKILPKANVPLFNKLHAAVLALDNPMSLTEAEVAGFNLLTAGFVTYDGEPDVLIDASVTTSRINRANPNVVSNLKGLRKLCKRLGVDFTMKDAEGLENTIFTYLCKHEVKITQAEIKSFAVSSDAKDYSDFKNMWDDEDDDFEDEDDDFDGETESNTQPDAAALAEAAKKAEAEAAKAAKKAQAQGSGKKPNVKA